MTSHALPSSRSVRPTMFGSPPNRGLQNRSLRTTTRSARAGPLRP